MAGISEFNISEKIASLKGGSKEPHDEDEAAGFIHRLKLFAEDFPTLENDIKNAFEKKDYACFSKCIESVRNTLSQISVCDLAPECDKLISAGSFAGCSASSDMNYEETEAQMAHLLSLLTMLSIDIQMAVYREENPHGNQPGQAELVSAALSDRDKIILAVDDNPFFLTALKKALSGTDYKLICVSVSSAALNFLEKQQQTASAVPNLFILDIEMPEMNGYELAEKIREKGAKAPIIFMTGNSAKEYVLKAIKAGAADFIVKPIRQEYVLAKVRKFI